MYNRLLLLKKELSNYHRGRTYLEKYYISKRLNESLNSYYKELEDSLRYLDNRQPENILKGMVDK